MQTIKSRNRKILYNLDADKIRFQDPLKITGPYRVGTRVNISYQDEDEEHPLVIAPEKMFFSFGVREDSYASKPTGAYSMCIVIDETDDETSKEYQFIKMIKDIEDKCAKRIEKRNKDIKFSKVVKRYDKEDGTSQYRIYPKLIITKDTGKVWSRFFMITEQGKSPKRIGMTDLKDKYCEIFPALLFDSLYFYQGGVSLQCKISEALIELIEMNEERDDLALDLSRLEL